jgi:hypothetical protein
VNTLRLLFWLRWRLSLNMLGTRRRWASLALLVLVGLAFTGPALLAAAGAHRLALGIGPAALPVVLGGAHLLVLWVSLVTGGMGRLLEFDKLRRYPLRPGTVFAINTVASLGEPVVLVVLPALVMVALGIATHSGPLAGLRAAGAALLLMLVTVSLLQLLLALLDDLLRREWMRYVAAFLFMLTVLGFQFAMRWASRDLAAQVDAHQLAPESLLAKVQAMFLHFPPVAAASTLGGAALEGPFASWPVALLLCAGVAGLSLAFGGRLVGRAALRPEAGTIARRGSAGSPWALPGLDRAQALLLQREFLYLQRTPALLYQTAVVLVVVLGLSLLNRHEGHKSLFMSLFLMTSMLAGRNLMLWSHDGPGLRTLCLMPLRTRDLILTKQLSWLLTTLLQGAFVIVCLSLVNPAEIGPWLPVLVPGFVAVALIASVIGSAVSITQPVRPPQQGLGSRNPGGLVGMLGYLAMLIVSGAMVGLVWAVRRLADDAWDLPASLIACGIALAFAWLVWSIGLDRLATLFEARRERILDVLARTGD